jgi:hypothetical protein
MSDDIGTLYVLSNRDQSLAKVGLTRDGTPEARATDYERAHGIRWHVYWSAFTCHVSEAEAAAHRELDICRFALVPGAREVFHVTPQKAKRVAEQFVITPPGTTQPPPSQHGSSTRGWLELAALAATLALRRYPRLPQPMRLVGACVPLLRQLLRISR